MQFQQTFQAVVTVDNATVQIVQIGSGKTAAIQWNQRTQIRWQYRQHIHNHPFQFHTGTMEGFQHFQAFGNFFNFGVRTGRFQLLTQDLDLAGNIQGAQQFADTFRTHFGIKVVAVFVQLIVVIVFSQQLTALQRSHAGIGYHECFKVQYAFDITQRHVQYHTQAGRQGFQEPDVGNRRSQFDMAHAFAAHFGQGNFYATFFTGYAFKFQAFVLTAQTFIVFDRTKDFGAEQTVALRFERTVVDGFRFFNFAIRP